MGNGKRQALMGTDDEMYICVFKMVILFHVGWMNAI